MPGSRPSTAFGPAGAASRSSCRLRPKISIASASAASRSCISSSIVRCEMRLDAPGPAADVRRATCRRGGRGLRCRNAPRSSPRRDAARPLRAPRPAQVDRQHARARGHETTPARDATGSCGWFPSRRSSRGTFLPRLLSLPLMTVDVTTPCSQRRVRSFASSSAVSAKRSARMSRAPSSADFRVRHVDRLDALCGRLARSHISPLPARGRASDRRTAHRPAAPALLRARSARVCGAWACRASRGLPALAWSRRLDGGAQFVGEFPLLFDRARIAARRSSSSRRYRSRSSRLRSCVSSRLPVASLR